VSRTLRAQLDRSVGFDEVGFTIPHVFLPPRFKDISKNRNMILRMDLDSVLHVKWEGALQEEHHPLTPGAVRRLVKECFRNMKKYRRDLEVFARFIDKEGEEPFWDDRADSLTKDRPARPAIETPDAKQKEAEIVAVLGPDGELIQGTVDDFLEEEMGGESALPDFGWG
jgi:hypothetical protein